MCAILNFLQSIALLDVNFLKSSILERACLGSIACVLLLSGCASLPKLAGNKEETRTEKVSPFAWANDSVEADGRGLAPSTITEEPQRSLAAKQAAKTAAISGLKHRIARLTIAGSHTVGTAMAINLSVKRAIEKYLQSAEVVHEKEIEPGVWEVRLRAPLAPISDILLQHRITPEGIPVLPVADQRVPKET
ncbi:MAG: hypothetical protein N2Z21_08690 [Candidatus Sumerlaeaceae bacterium]|nr:hypothetical protein [Candidatus Sumerlaeaceae bacterium]